MTTRMGRPPKVPYDQLMREFVTTIRTSPMGSSFPLGGYARKCHLGLDEVIKTCRENGLYVRAVGEGPMKQARALVTLDTMLFRRGPDKS